MFDLHAPSAEVLPGDLLIAPGVLNQVFAEATRAAPRECCGLLLGRGERIEAARPVENRADEPLCRFEIDPQALIDAHRAARQGGPELIGYYHSHPVGPAEPSATDRAMAARDGKVWAIVGGCDVTFWRDDRQGFTRLSCRVVHG